MSIEQSTIELIWNFSCLQLPIGVYFVAPDGQFLACNQPVRKMLDLPLEGPVEASIADFYADPAQRAELLRLAIMAEAKGWHLEKAVIKFRLKGCDLYVENYCKPLRDPATGEITGYVGCLVDITTEQEAEEREEALKSKVHELTYDIGRVLHANTNTLVMAQQTLDAVGELLQSAVMKDLGAASAAEQDDRLVEGANRLATAIERLFLAGDAERRAKALAARRWDLLATRAGLLRQIRETIQIAEMRLPTLRKVAHEIGEVCQEILPKELSREAVREVLQAALALEQLACLVDVLNTRTAIIQMDHSLRVLRDYITSDVRAPEVKTHVAVNSLVEQAITQLAEFARSSNVEILWRDRSFAGEVKGNERDLLRAISNLLHNAIKYTWRRDRAGSPWVTVRTHAKNHVISIEFENWGVPISRDELEHGLVFHLGYRGKWSTDRGRLGTGIGLTDVQRVAHAHGGEVLVSSRPAAAAATRNPEDDTFYKQAFITTVTLSLPQAGYAKSKG
jgi:signal transduction histidine kinase